MSNDAAGMRAQIDRLQRQVSALQSPVSEVERDALTKAQHRVDSVAPLVGMGIAPPRLGESSHAYRLRAASALANFSPELKGSRFDSVDPAALGALEEKIFADCATTARGGQASPGKLTEVKERDPSGRLITKYFGDPMVWMAPFMSQGHSGRINRKPNEDR